MKFEEVPQQNQKIEFEMNVIEEIDGELKLQSQNFNLNYNLLDRIQTHPMLLETKPCYLSHEESYKIIRNHIKANLVLQIPKGFHTGFQLRLCIC
ncbi:hypothetical protein ACMXZI_15255 [Bacillus subtilis]|uniref:hypothetical protein n=1 Tax=Bacillus subtilis TaxID=1423 RepID=UPI0039E39A75